jgi:hypothetical protein
MRTQGRCEMVGSTGSKICRVLAIIVGLLALALTMIAAVPKLDTEIPTLCDLLAWLRTVEGVQIAAPVVVGVAVSFLIETWAGWEGVAPKAKRWIIFGANFAVPLAALALTVLLCGAALTVEMIYVALAAGFVAFGSSTMAHLRKLGSA